MFLWNTSWEPRETESENRQIDKANASKESEKKSIKYFFRHLNKGNSHPSTYNKKKKKKKL